MKTNTTYFFSLCFYLLYFHLVLLAPSLHAQDIPIACDGDLESKLSNTNDVKTFVFNSTGNEYATIRVQNKKSNSFMLTRIELYSPDGKKLASAEVPSIVDNYATIRPVKLELPGVYKIKVLNSNTFFFSTGEFGLSLQIIKPSCALPLNCSELHDIKFEKPAQTDAYWFVAHPGDHFIFRLQNIGLIKSNVLAYTLKGDSIAPSPTLLDADLRFDFDFTKSITSDTILILIRDDQNFFSGNYIFGFQNLSPFCTQTLNCDDDLSGALNYTQMTSYSIPIKAGDKMIFRTKGDDLYKIEFYHRDGTTWFPTVYSSNYKMIVLKNSFSETDTLIIVALRNTSNASYYTPYGLSIQMLRPDCAVPLNCNIPIGGTFSHLAQMEAFRFDVKNGDKVLIRAGAKGNNAFSKRLEVYSPNSFPNPIWEMEETDLRFEKQIDTSGIWYAVLMQKDIINPSNGATYGVSFHQLNNMDCGNPIAYNTNLTDQIEYPGIIDSYVFNGNVGDVLLAQTGNCLEYYQAAIELYDSLGNRIAMNLSGIIGGGDARLDTIHLLATGRYKLLAYENYWSATEQYGLSIQKLNPGQKASILKAGQTINDSLAYATDTHVYTFDGNQGGGFTLKVYNLSSNLHMYTQVFDPVGHPIGVNYTIGNDIGAITKTNLSASGTYTVLTWGYSGCPKGSYNLILTSLVGLDDAAPHEKFALSAYPNPFSDNISIEFNPPISNHVRLEILNTLGEVIAIPMDEKMEAGRHKYNWSAPEFISGVYFLKLQFGNKEYFKKLLLIKN